VSLPHIGIVVPTLGTRPNFLNQALRSIRLAGNCHIAIVAPNPEEIKRNYRPDLYDSVVEDPKQGLAVAINAGMDSLPTSVKFANWLGDDDLLAPESLKITSEFLERFTNTVCVYGKCSYIGPNGESVWTNRSGTYAKWLMRIGPQLIPQPGSLFVLSAFNKVNKLNPQYKWAFDLDLLLKLSKIGDLHYIPQILSSFRWHDESLSVGGRQGSVEEASRIRRAYLPRPFQFICPLWESVIPRLILATGAILSRRSRRYQENA
jgi:hypothetical protein